MQHAAQEVAQRLGRDLAGFLYSLLVQLDQMLDKRLVRTFLHTIVVILSFRDRLGRRNELSHLQEPWQGELPDSARFTIEERRLLPYEERPGFHARGEKQSKLLVHPAQTIIVEALFLCAGCAASAGE